MGVRIIFTSKEMLGIGYTLVCLETIPNVCAVMNHGQCMGCNMDHQPFLCLDDPLCPTSDHTYVCADYICAYCGKGNPKPAVAIQL